MKMEQSVPKRRHIKFRRRGITQKEIYNIQNTAIFLNQETQMMKTAGAFGTPVLHGVTSQIIVTCIVTDL
jgi:hypothetical protein